GGVFTDENYAVVSRRGEPELLSEVNRAIGNIIADGRYAKIYAKWMGEPLAPGGPAALEKVKDRGTPVTDRPTGSAFTIRWSLLRTAMPLLLKGCVMTLYLTVLTLLIGIPAGLL